MNKVEKYHFSQDQYMKFPIILTVMITNNITILFERGIPIHTRRKHIESYDEVVIVVIAPC